MLSFKRSCFTLLSLAFSSISVSGASIFFTNFGSDSIGNINGQDGWTTVNSAVSFDNVENTLTDGTPQAAWVIPNPDQSGQTGMYHTDTASGSPLIDLSTYMYIASSSSENEWQFAALGSGLFPFIGGIDLFPTAGPSDTIEALTAGFPVLGAFSLDTWHNVDLLFNFSSQTYTVTLDGTVLLANAPFCGDNGPCTAGTPIAEGQFLSFFDVFATLNSNDLGAVDNWSLSSVPEPATYGLTGAALLAGAYFLRRKRNR